MEAAPPARRGFVRRWVRRLAVLGVLTVVLAAAIVWFAPALAAGPLRGRVLALAAGQIDGTLAVEEMQLGWLRPVELSGVTLTDPDGRKAVEVGAIRSSKTLLGLAAAGGDFGTFTVERPVVHAVIDGQSSNLEQMFAKHLSGESAPAAGDRAAVKVEVTDGKLVLSDARQPGEGVFEGLAATATVPRSRAEPVTVTAKLTAPGAAKTGTADADLSFGEALDAKVRMADLPLESLAAAVRRFAAGTTLAGRAGADLHVTRTAGEKPTLAVTGAAGVDALAAAGPWANGGDVRFERVSLAAGKVTLAGGVLALQETTLSCDAGRVTATAEVSTADPVGELFTTPGLTVDVDLDAAKLAAAMPRVMRLKPGTSLTDGKLTAKVTSAKGPAGVRWAGTASAANVRGLRDGKPLAWERPLQVTFDGHLRASNGLPEFDKLEAVADFVGLAARGSAERFVARAVLDLDRLAARLADFADLGGTALGGTADVTVRTDPAPDGSFKASLTADVNNFKFADAAGRAVTEPKLTVNAAATGRHTPGGPVRLDTLTANVAAAGDRAEVQLVEPVADLRSARTGTVRAAVEGDLARWRGRTAPFYALPADWVIGGTGPVRAVAALTASGVTVTDMAADLSHARFVGSGVDLNEPTLAVKSNATWDRGSGAVTLEAVSLSCPTLTLDTPRVELAFPATGTTVRTTAKVAADLAGVARTLKMATPLAGKLTGTVATAPESAATGFDADLRVESFAYGPPQSPTWREPWVTAKAKGTYGGAAVTVPAFTLARDGLTLAGLATVGLAGAKPLDASGTLGYDLAKLEPQLKELLGQTLTARGQGSRPFRAAGSLADIGTLTAQAGLSWDTLRAYGFDIGASELTLTADAGKAATTPIVAAFGGGTVRVEPAVNLASPGYDLTLAPGKLIQTAKLTPAVCASALGYALPAFANAAQADGTVSFDLAENRVPLTAPQSGTAKGVLTVHAANVSAGPLVTEIATALGAKQTSMTLTREQQVPIKLENGRVHHENFAIQIGETQVTSSGSVGLDQTVSVVLDMPVPPKLLSGLLANNPRAREALSKQRIKVPVGGTLKKPVLDNRGMNDSVQALARGAARDALGTAATEVQDKVRDKLREELEKKAGKLPFPFPVGPKKP